MVGGIPVPASSGLVVTSATALGVVVLAAVVAVTVPRVSPTIGTAVPGVARASLPGSCTSVSATRPAVVAAVTTVVVGWLVAAVGVARGLMSLSGRAVTAVGVVVGGHKWCAG